MISNSFIVLFCYANKFWILTHQNRYHSRFITKPVKKNSFGFFFCYFSGRIQYKYEKILFLQLADFTFQPFTQSICNPQQGRRNNLSTNWATFHWGKNYNLHKNKWASYTCRQTLAWNTLGWWLTEYYSKKQFCNGTPRYQEERVHCNAYLSWAKSWWSALHHVDAGPK